MITLDADGLDIQTYDEILDEIITSLQTDLSLTAAQAQRLRDSVQSSLGNLARNQAGREQQIQEAMLAVYNTLSWDTSDANLDRVVRLLGITRIPAANSRVLASITGGNAGVAIPDGTRYQYNPSGAVFLSDGAVVLDVSGEYRDLPLVAESDAAIEVALEPDTGYDDWTLLDALSHAGDLYSTEQPIVGHPIETDAALRTRGAREAYRRAQGPLVAIDAAVADVTGVTYVRTYDNHGPFGSVDADGIPGKAINVVVEGGSDLDVANAIWRSRSAGAQMYGSETQDIVDRYGRTQAVGFDRVTETAIHIRATLTTSTSEETAATDVAAIAAARLLERAPLLFGIGQDVIPARLVAQLADLEGVDAVAIELSLDGVSFSTAKRVISIRARPTFDAANIDIVEN